MRITTWNCCRGNFDQKFSAVVEREQPTIIALQEIARPKGESVAEQLGYTIRWNGTNPNQGFGLAANGEIETFDPGISTEGACAFIVRLDDRLLHILNIWAKPAPKYPENVWRNLDLYSDFLKAESSIVLGDFNSPPGFDSNNQRKHHALVDRLREDFNLFSAYHHDHDRSQGEEPHATHYWTWNQEKPFHLDYIFLPNDWQQDLEKVTVGDFDSWQSLSDHRPLTAVLRK